MKTIRPAPAALVFYLVSACLVAQAAGMGQSIEEPTQVPRNAISLQEIKQTFEGPLLVRTTPDELKTLIEDAPVAKRPFKKSDSFLMYILLPDSGIGIYDPFRAGATH
jgi:hypothetical protein